MKEELAADYTDDADLTLLAFIRVIRVIRG